MATPIYIEGFEVGDIPGVGNGGISSSTKRTGSYSLRRNPVTTGTAATTLRTGGADGTPGVFSAATAYYRFYIYVAALPGSGYEAIFNARDSSSGLKLILQIGSDGTLRVLNEIVGTLGTTTETISTSTWTRIEVQVGTGTDAPWELRIDGTTVLSGTSSLLGTNNNALFQLGKFEDNAGQGYDIYFDDVRIDNDGFPGAGEVKRVAVDGVGSDTAWSSSGGGSSVASDVNTFPFADDGAYAVTSTNPSAQTYSLESAASAGITGTINAVRAHSYCRDVGGTSAVKLRVRSGSNVYDSSAADLGSYDQQTHTFSGEPVSGDPWTATLLNALEIGVVSESTEQTRCQGICAQVEYTPGAGNAPAAPSGLTATATGPDSVQLDWTDNAGASDDQEDEFEAQYDTNENFTNPTTVTGITADLETYEITGIPFPNHRYYFRIRAVNGAGNSSWSNTATENTDPDSVGSIDFSTEGIVATFDTSYSVGVYQDEGGWYVVADGSGDFTLSSLAVSAGVVSDDTIGGVMVDPGESGMTEQGLVPALGSYNASLNESLPLTVNVSGGPKTIWFCRLLDTPEAGGGNSYVYSLVQLTIVPSLPAADAIKPTGLYVSGGKPQYTTADIDYDALASVDVDGAESESDWTATKMLQRPWVKFGTTVASSQLAPTLTQDSYPADSVRQYVNPVLRGACSDSLWRKTLIDRIIRCALDVRAQADLGGTAFMALGGFGPGGKALLHFASFWLTDAAIRATPSTVDYGGNSQAFFHEDGCCFRGDADGTWTQGVPLYGTKASSLYPGSGNGAGVNYHFNHDIRTSAQVEIGGTVTREPHWITYLSDIASAGGSSSVTLPNINIADANGLDGVRVWNDDTGELNEVATGGWNNSTKVATLTGSWSVNPSNGDYIELYNGGTYETIGAHILTIPAMLAVLTDTVTEWGFDPFFDFVWRWVEELGGRLSPRIDDSGGISDDTRKYGDTAGTWGKPLWTAASAIWPSFLLDTPTVVSKTINSAAATYVEVWSTAVNSISTSRTFHGTTLSVAIGSLTGGDGTDTLTFSLSPTGGVSVNDTVTVDIPPGAVEAVSDDTPNNEALGESVTNNSTLDVPDAPANLAGTPGVGQITWTWDAAAGATSYTLSYGTDMGGPYPNSTATTGLSKRITGLALGTYYAVVVASNTFGDSDPSTEANAEVTELQKGGGSNLGTRMRTRFR